MYVENDAYYSFRENAWATEANPCSFVYKEKPERAYYTFWASSGQEKKCKV